MGFTQRHLLGLEGVPADEITTILDTAASFKEISERDIKKVPTLRGKTVINLFYEASTRTRTWCSRWTTTPPSRCTVA